MGNPGMEAPARGDGHAEEGVAAVRAAWAYVRRASDASLDCGPLPGYSPDG